jgi:diguanylate cyclase (GGDEF)-like protein/PAS domain S-box-containing protein
MYDRRGRQTVPMLHEPMFLGAAIALVGALCLLACCLTLLIRSRRREERLWELTGEGLAEVSTQGVVRRGSEALSALCGRDLVGRPLNEVIHPLDGEAMLAALNPLAPGGRIRTASVRVRAADDSWTEVRLRARVDRLTKTVDVALGEPGRSQQAIDAFERVFSMAPIGMAVVADGVVRRVNRRMTELVGEDRTGYELERLVSAGEVDMIREQLARLVARELHAVTLKLELRHVDGHTLPAIFSVSLLRDDAGEPRQYIVQVQDVAETEQLEAEVRHATEHDSLTGLLNRAALLPLLSKLPGEPAALAIVDIDEFGELNDTFGTAAGDTVLEAVALRLTDAVGEHGALARIGGDEFGVLMSDVDTPAARALTEALLAAVSARPVEVAGAHLSVSASAGIALSDDLLLHATEALAEAKGRGRNAIAVYDPSMRQKRASGRSWADKVRRGLDSERLLLDAQPIVSAENGDPVMFELLLRMRDEDGSVVRPNAFLAPAKRHGLMGAVDAWVIGQAVQYAARSGVDLCVNISEESLADRVFLAAAVQQLMDAPETGRHLIFELTERTALAGRGAAQQLMARLSEFGCRFALDDFGAGTAALRHMNTLPVEFLKLDGQLTRALPTDADDRAIAEAVVSAAHALGKTVVAECVEDEAILAAVREIGVELVQGLHVGRPQRAGELFRLAAPR